MSTLRAYPRLGSYLLILALLPMAIVAVAAEREVIPPPPGGGDGVRILPADQENPLPLPAPDPGFAPPPAEEPAAMADKAMRGILGGDDVVVFGPMSSYDYDMAISSDGDLFVACMYTEGDLMYRIVIRRSDDGGTTWRTWAEYVDPDPVSGTRFSSPELHVAEGAEDRVFLTYCSSPASTSDYFLHMAWSPLDAADGDFSNDTVIHTSGHLIRASLDSDATNFTGYFVYVAFSTRDATGSDIWFTRSTDQGATWESPYMMAEIAVSDRGYYAPEVRYGFGGYVHVAWDLGFQSDHEFDDCLRYRRAANYANGGLGSWDPMASLTSHLNDVNEDGVRLGVSRVSGDVMLAAMRYDRDTAGGSPDYAGVGTLSSADQGATWTGITVLGSGLDWLGDVIHQHVNARWLLGVDDEDSWGFRWAPVASPAAWSDLEVFSDGAYFSGGPELVLDPTHGDRVGIVGVDREPYPSYQWFFDAEWRSDPGYPVVEDGFPVDLAVQPLSDPAMVDIDGDGDLEIVFSSQNNTIDVYHHDGSVADGWPAQVPATLSDGPVAIGDMRGNGDMILIVGTTDGRAYAFESDGSPVDGWPYDTGGGGSTYVTIGALLGPYHRMAVVASGEIIRIVNDNAVPYHGLYWTWPGRTINAPLAVGDVDGDGLPEIVGAASDWVFAIHATEPSGVFGRGMPADVSDAVTLGDFDLDGDVEVVVPLSNGYLYLLDDDGSDFPGAWPFDAASGGDLSSAAIANCLGNGEPEIAVANHWSIDVHLLWEDGIEQMGYPVQTDGWYIWGSPIMGYLADNASADVIAGARGARGWAWDNFGGRVDGWPEEFEDNVQLTPAMGDLDLDGSAEIAFLSTGQLIVVDVSQTLAPASQTWPMYGHDPRRSGCADCPEDLVTAIDQDTGDRITRVSFASPSPNPVSGRAVFSYALPVRARVELGVYDVRGRRVALVAREEAVGGRHTIAWNGRDDDGRPLASGQYVARLTVRGPGLSHQLTRKVTILQ